MIQRRSAHLARRNGGKLAAGTGAVILVLCLIHLLLSYAGLLMHGLEIAGVLAFLTYAAAWLWHRL